MTTQPTISPGLRFLLSAACIVIVAAGLKAAKTILVPLALAVFVAVVSLPLLNIARRKGVPTGLAILFVFLLDASALVLLGWLVSLAAIEIQMQLPFYLDRLQELEAFTITWFAERGIQIGEIATVWFPTIPGDSGAGPTLDVQRLFGFATFLVGKATDLLTLVFLVVLLFVFMLAEASSLPRKIRMALGRRTDGLGRSANVVHEIQHYLAIKTLISAATGLTIGVATWAVGLDFPLLWGLLAFILNFIPNVGSILAAVPPIIVALLQIGPGTAVLTTAIYVGANALFGNFLEPMLVGRQLGLSTLVVILSLLFWGWLWGPVGMFLSVPLTMGLKIGLENSEEFRWLAMLMTSDRGGRMTTSAPPPVPTLPAPSQHQESGVS